MRAAKYRRVSTIMQVEKGVSLETQNERLNAYITSQGWTCVEDYVDDGFSAKDLKRPGMQQLIEDIESEKFDVLLVYRLDRFIRSVSDLHKLLKLMEKHDVKFKSATEVYDTTTAAGRLFITLVAAMAQWEREQTAERVFENMMSRSENGYRNGAPAPYGYDIIEGKLVINHDEAQWVKYIFKKALTHGSQYIAKQLNKRGVKTKKGEIWSDFSVRYLLRNPIYIGQVRWNHRSLAKGKLTGEDIITPIQQEDFEPLIEEEDFKEVALIMKNRSKMAFKANTPYPFSGIGKCGKCGKSLTGSSKKRKNNTVHRFYKCQGRFKFGICDQPVIAENTLEETFFNALTVSIDNFQPSKETSNADPEVDKEHIENELEKVKLKRERAEEMYLEGDIDKKRYKDILENARSTEEDLMKMLKEEVSEVASEEDVMLVLQNIKETYPQMSFEDKKIAIQTIFESVTIDIIKKARTGKNAEPAVLEITDYQFR
ncbi:MULTISPECIES: recombinase family protein [Pontibacillus]|uniref:Recombinase family protein n=1 Tax=Pontibacillus chungwhensis TaxID=265426 RepID=A0ABY8UYF9_9BACI|nr:MULTISPECIES: recombinase family protein [Pontibacillus]MCD5324741.1 recombinase family protein [Pontibacillus sp. HN14]WIF98700.1 recombinase family protein [Pontibacillus chungwhensis]